MPIISGVIASSKTGHLQPLAPTIGTATDGGTGTTVLVTYTPAATGPAATSFTATAYISGVSTGITATTSSTTSVTVSGLTAGTTYTFTVHATNTYGNSPESAASNSVAPIVPSSFTSIATITCSGGEANITFSSIPQNYTDLQVRSFVRSSYSGTTFSAFLGYINGDTGSNYSNHAMYANGNQTGALTFSQTSNSNIYGVWSPGNAGMPATSGLANTYAGHVWEFMDYTNTSKAKVIKMLGGVSQNQNATNSEGIGIGDTLWNNTSAISSITLFSGYNYIAAGTIFALYGIKAAA